VTTQVLHHTCLALCKCCTCFPTNTEVSVFHLNPVQWTYHLNAIDFSLNLYTDNNVSTSKVSEAENCKNVKLPILSCLSLLCMCGLGLCPFNWLVCDLLLRKW